MDKKSLKRPGSGPKPFSVQEFKSDSFKPFTIGPVTGRPVSNAASHPRSPRSNTPGQEEIPEPLKFPSKAPSRVPSARQHRGMLF